MLATKGAPQPLETKHIDDKIDYVHARRPYPKNATNTKNRSLTCENCHQNKIKIADEANSSTVEVLAERQG